MARRSSPRSKTKVSKPKASTPNPGSNDKPTGSVLSIETLALIVLIFVSVGLRGSAPERMTVEHYDEGVYTSNQFFDAEADGRYPGRHYYAPSLMPSLFEWWQIFFGGTGWTVNLLFGVGLTVLTYLVLRSRLGTPTAFLAAMFVATGDTFIMYSRTHLTDVPVTFWMLAAVAIYERGIRHHRRELAVLTGLLTATAWWTKYTGWLPLAVILSASIPWLLCRRERGPAAKEVAIHFLLALVTAVACWSPYLIDLQKYGGYSSVAGNHSGFVVGLDGWNWSFRWQAENLRLFTQVATPIGLFVGLVGYLALRWRQTHEETRSEPESQALSRWLPVSDRFGVWVGLIGGLILAGACLLPGSLLPMIGGVACSLWGMGAAVWRRFGPEESSATDGEETGNPLMIWLFSAWFWGMTLSIPTYFPYPRLLLAWLLPAWVLTAFVIARLADLLTARLRSTEGSAMRNRLSVGLVAAAVTIGLGIAGYRDRNDPTAAWEDRHSQERAAGQLLKILNQIHPSETAMSGPNDSPPEFVIYFFGEPGSYYHFRLQHPLTAPVALTGVRRVVNDPQPLPTYLVTGKHQAWALERESIWSDIGPRLEEVAIVRYVPSILMLSNNPDSDRYDHAGAVVPSEELTLWRVKPLDEDSNPSDH